jgi:hypothetical protein
LGSFGFSVTSGGCFAWSGVLVGPLIGMTARWARNAALPMWAPALALLIAVAACAGPPLAPLAPQSTAPPASPTPGPAVASAPEYPALREAATPDCRITQVASLPLLPFAADKPVVEIALNGRPARMQVDTGAETSVLTMAGAASVGVSPGPSRQPVEGLGGTAAYGTVRLDRIVFGGQILRGTELPVMRLRGDSGLDGLIGADLLAPYQVLLDMISRRMVLFRAGSCAEPRPSFPSTGLAWVSRHAMPIVAARLNGRTITALLDTGANHSAANSSEAGLTEADLSNDPRVNSYGAGALPVAGRVHRFGSLILGGLSLPGPTLRVVTLDPALGIGLVIGMDILGARRLWLDYPGRQTFIEVAQGS